MSLRGILIAGVGNIFLGDDGFGVEVVRRLSRGILPCGVEVRDFGVRGLDLAFAMADGYAAVIVIDAVSRGLAPGTLCVLEPKSAEDQPLAFHNCDPAKAIRMARALAGELPALYLIGCEPATFGPPEEGAMELSEPVKRAVDEAAGLVLSLVERLQVDLSSVGGFAG